MPATTTASASTTNAAGTATRAAELPGHESLQVPVGVRPARWYDGAATRRDLSGTWRFRLFPEAATGADPADDGAAWDELAVPGHWQLAQAPDAWPYGKPAYTNVIFPIPVDPPRVPRANPTGEYRLTFAVAPEETTIGRLVLRFEGVDSWFEVAVNGVPCATSHGSRLPTEIDITDLVHPGENLLAVRVTQWSAQTYVEDQDQWWLSGIFREVTLEHRPVGGIEHVEVSAEYDHIRGLGTLRISAEATDAAEAPVVRVPELGLEVSAGEEVSVAVEPWSAEAPRLYDATVSTPAETVSLRIGFRTIAITDGVFTVNGAPVKLYGVNRHEFEPTRGRAVSAETMLQDVLLMKEHHVNAVRTSHYPPHPDFLALCDTYGLYVIDENDLETHGFELQGWRGNPTDDPAWTPLLVDRVTRMVRRDAHHPSIVMWSLGNEAGTGRNLAAMAEAIRALDDSRPLHYEGDWSSEHVDVYSRMYASTQEVALIGRGEEPALGDGELDARRRGMPFMQCEYVHAMGNGPGGFTDYDDLFEAHPRLMGGFVWEWIDHGVATRAADGTAFFGYGGDFGEELHDGSFIVDGLLLPDRTPSPGMIELAAVYAPIRIEAIEQLPGTIEVRNRYAFRTTEHVALRWSLLADGEEVASGEVDAEVIEPGESLLLTPEAVGAEIPLIEEGPAVWWRVWAQVRPESRAEWEPEGFVLGAGQVMLSPHAGLETPTGDVVALEDGWQVGPVRLDGAGRPVSIGHTAVAHCRIDAWRARTNNDLRPGGQTGGEATPLPADGEVWQRAGLARLHERLDDAALVGGAVVVTGRTAGAGTDCGFAVQYTWRTVDERTAEVSVSIVPDGVWSGPVARLGWWLALEQAEAGAVAVDWVGQGPGESYADSHRAALHGRYTHTVDSLQTAYSVPQENGARRGVTQVRLGLAGGDLEVEVGEVTLGTRVIEGAEVSARPWSDAALDAAAHPHEVAPDGLLHLHLDAAQHGLGTAACGPGVLPNAALRPAPATIQLRLRTPAPEDRRGD